MTVNTNTLVSITEANQNFSKVAKLVDQNGSVVILKNNVPRYVVLEFSEVEKMQTVSDEDIADISKDLSQKILKHTRSLRNDKTYNKTSYIHSQFFD